MMLTLFVSEYPLNKLSKPTLMAWATSDPQLAQYVHKNRSRVVAMEHQEEVAEEHIGDAEEAPITAVAVHKNKKRAQPQTKELRYLPPTQDHIGEAVSDEFEEQGKQHERKSKKRNVNFNTIDLLDAV